MIKLLLILFISSTYVLGTSSPLFGLKDPNGESFELIDLKLKAIVNLEAPYKEVQYLATYKNSKDHSPEAVFHFPRHGNFIFHQFEAIFHRNKTLVGKITAREDNHTEPDSSEIVNITVGRLEPNETVQILFSVIQHLEVVFNKFFELKFPAITNQEPPLIFNSDLQEWNIQVEITSKKPLSILSNPTHRLKPEESNSTNPNATSHKAVWNVTIPTDKEFIVYFAPERLSDIEILSVTHPDDPNDYLLQFTALPDMRFFSDSFAQNALQNTSDDGLLTLQKVAFRHDQRHLSPRYIFMLDRSDSMKGPRFETLKKALIDLLQVLPESNEVEILSFGSTFELYKIKDNGTPTAKEAIEYVKTLEANMGEKNLLTTMNYVVKKFLHHTVIIILTDGEVSFPDQITQVVSEHSKWIKTCTLGIGNEASRTLLQGIASAGKCGSEFIAENEELGEKAFHLMQGTIYRFGFEYAAYFLCQNHDGEMVVEDGCDDTCSLPADWIVKDWIHLNNKSDIKSCRFDINIFSELREISGPEKEGEISNFENAQITDTNFYHKIAYSTKLSYKEKELERGYYSLEDDNDERFKAAKQQVIDQSLKYQILSRFTQLVPVLQETLPSHDKVRLNSNIQSF